MKVLVRKSTNQPLQLKEINGDPKEIQEIVGGTMKTIPMMKDLVCICNEEGKEKGLERNFFHDYFGWILGTIIFISKGDKGFASLTDSQINFIKEYVGSPVVKA